MLSAYKCVILFRKICKNVRIRRCLCIFCHVVFFVKIKWRITSRLLMKYVLEFVLKLMGQSYLFVEAMEMHNLH